LIARVLPLIQVKVLSLHVSQSLEENPRVSRVEGQLLTVTGKLRILILTQESERLTLITKPNEYGFSPE
jgi:hypothetical protein